MKKIFSIFVLTLTASFVFSNTIPEKKDSVQLIQFSGVLLTSDSLHAIPYAHIVIKNTYRGTISNFDGFFSFVAHPGDSIEFSALGFKKKYFQIPEYLQAKKYSVIQLMTQDTINLPETFIYPWPSPEQFKQAFLSLNIPDDDLERAKKNLHREALKQMGETMARDANEIQDFSMNQYAKSFYSKGQYPSYQIFSPMAWVAFFEAWKRGDFKKK